MVSVSSSRFRSNPPSVVACVNSSGTQGELRRIGLPLPKTIGLIRTPITLPGKDARLGLMTPMAI